MAGRKRKKTAVNDLLGVLSHTAGRGHDTGRPRLSPSAGLWVTGNEPDLTGLKKAIIRTRDGARELVKAVIASRGCLQRLPGAERIERVRNRALAAIQLLEDFKGEDLRLALQAEFWAWVAAVYYALFLRTGIATSHTGDITEDAHENLWESRDCLNRADATLGELFSLRRRLSRGLKSLFRRVSAFGRRGAGKRPDAPSSSSLAATRNLVRTLRNIMEEGAKEILAYLERESDSSGQDGDSEGRRPPDQANGAATSRADSPSANESPFYIEGD